MADNPVQEYAAVEDHVVNVVNQDLLTLMHQKLAHPPGIPSRSTGRSSCSIFRAPQNLVRINGQCYKPEIVSIGPYHRDESKVEDHKWRFLNGLLKRTEGKGLTLVDYLREVQSREEMARECYLPAIEIPRDEFIEMLVLDGCFVIELFRKFGNVIDFEADDPLLSQSWMYPFFLKDLIRLENQIPFFILECLFDLTQMDDEKKPELTLSILTLKFFNNALLRSEKFLNKFEHLEGKHLLDFLRMSFIPEGLQQLPGRNQKNGMKPDVIPCISKLRRAGIKLRARSSDNFLVVNFKHGVIEMPTITVDDFMKAFLQNCVAYEQCHRDCPRYMTAYAKLLDCLINTAKDVEHLCDENVIENRLGTNGEVAGFINKMGKEVQYFDAYKHQLSGLFEKVNKYYNSRGHVHWASFKNKYFRTPWSFISAVAAIVLLILTATQTLYTVISYVRPR